METWMETITPYLTMYGLRIAAAILILIAGRLFANIAKSLVRKLLVRANVEPSITTFTTSLVHIIITIVAVMAAISKFGIETTSFVAILGAATFAVGFALKDSLSNFASGVLTLVLRPYRVGDSIDVAGVRGTVKEIRLFVTVLATGDNVQILVPNARIYDGIIRNFSVNSNRRIDLVIGIGYDSSIKTARNLLEKILSEDERILEDPAPFVGVAELADSSVNFVVRPWVKRQDHWATKCDLIERIKLAFDEHGIEMPYPQRTIHMAEKTG